MPAHSADALILRTYRYGEADRIVVFLTCDRGKKRGVAKNATKSRRRFGAALEPLTRGRVTYLEREGRELVRLDRIEPSATPLSAAEGRDGAVGAQAIGHASYFAELIDEWAPDDSQNERLFRLGSAIGAALGEGGSVEALARYFEYWLLRLEGVYPSLIVCPQCEQPTLGEGAVLVGHDRSYVCAACAHADATLSPEAMRFLRSLGTRTPSEVTATGASARSLREIEHAHHRLIALYLEKELRSARVVKELRPS
jgi:DNA repair protein RecO (recombination protein O)